MQLSSRQRVLMESNSLNRYIDSIPTRLQATKQNQQIAVESKYYHLVSSTKPIQHLVQKYKYKITQFIEDLENKHKIKEITRQIQLYKMRAKEMEDLEKELDFQVEKQKNVQYEKKEAVKEIRNKLNSLKLQNATIAYQIQLQNNKNSKQSKKSQQKAERTKLFPSQSFSERQIRLLCQQQQQLRKQLFNKIHSKVQINQILLEGLVLIRQSLKKSQKKSHEHGLAGSMFFKLSHPQKQNRIHAEGKMDSNFKSLVYNTLKDKYKSMIKKSKQQNIEVDSKRFLQFNELQTVGVMELKPQSFLIVKYLIQRRIYCLLSAFEDSS